MKQIYSQRSYRVLVGFGTFLFVFILFSNFLYSFCFCPLKLFCVHGHTILFVVLFTELIDRLIFGYLTNDYGIKNTLSPERDID